MDLSGLAGETFSRIRDFPSSASSCLDICTSTGELSIILERPLMCYCVLLNVSDGEGASSLV